MRIEVRTTAEEKRHWQEIAASRGMDLSSLIRSLMTGQRRSRRKPPPVADPALLRQLASIGNNLNQLARVSHWYARRGEAIPAAAILARLIEIDRELSVIRRAHEASSDAA